MTMRLLAASFLTAALSCAMPLPSMGAEAGAQRFTMSPADGGVVRLDTATGAMSVCSGKEGAWSCRDIAEGGDSARKRLEALEQENKALKDEVRRLQDAAVTPPGDAVKPFAMPEEKDVDRAFDYVESLIRKFRERIKKLEEQDGEAGTPL